MDRMKKLFLVLLVMSGIFFNVSIAKEPKIVALLAVHNERLFIKQALKGLALYADGIVLLDDASDDDTLALVESLKDECKIERIISKKVWHRDEAGDRNLLLNVGREIGGTHFIILDADELISAPSLKDNHLRNRILQLEPGERLLLPWVQVWRSPYTYRSDSSPWAGHFGDFIFCDEPSLLYTADYFLHATRSPIHADKKSMPTVKINVPGVVILHFQFSNWRNLLIKQAWYRCLEHIRLPNKPVEEINELYGHSKNEKTLQLSPIPEQWLAGYDFYDANVFFESEVWREKQIMGWFKEYGIDYFKDLDIWDIDWNLEQVK
jgi:glycosyltransferase involved in cell wall biosynthesis